VKDWRLRVVARAETNRQRLPASVPASPDLGLELDSPLGTTLRESDEGKAGDPGGERPGRVRVAKIVDATRGGSPSRSARTGTGRTGRDASSGRTTSVRSTAIRGEDPLARVSSAAGRDDDCAGPAREARPGRNPGARPPRRHRFARRLLALRSRGLEGRARTLRGDAPGGRLAPRCPHAPLGSRGRALEPGGAPERTGATGLAWRYRQRLRYTRGRSAGLADARSRGGARPPGSHARESQERTAGS
jgi:hypothetical protein